MKILVIDDEVRVRELFRMWLEKAGFVVYDAENGLKGIEAHKKYHVDLLICDLIMPVQEGIETITQFRNNYPEIGIIAMSGGGKLGPDSYLAVAEQLGTWRVFTKPVDMVKLVQAIKAWQQETGVQ